MPNTKLSGDSTLENLNNAIVSNESGGYRFTGCTINQGLNVLDFELGRVSRAYLVRSGEIPTIENPTLKWSGQMRIEGKNIAIQLYRISQNSNQILPQELINLSAAIERKAFESISEMPMISRESVVNRSLSAVDSDTEFDIYSSSSPALNTESWPQSGAKIDCSGFIAWCFRTQRKISHPLYRKANGGWFETSALFKDGLEKSGYFTKTDQAKPGSLLVYPDKNGKHGHVGLVIEVNGEGVNGVVSVVHCSKGNFKRNKKAIQITNPKLWQDRKDSIIIDFEGFT